MHICMSECKAPVIDVPSAINDHIWGPQSIFIRCGISGCLHMIYCSLYCHRNWLGGFNVKIWISYWKRTRPIWAGIEPMLHRVWFTESLYISPRLCLAKNKWCLTITYLSRLFWRYHRGASGSKAGFFAYMYRGFVVNHVCWVVNVNLR